MPEHSSSPQLWIIYACRTSYTAEVVEIIWRRGDGIDLLVDNLGDVELMSSDVGTVVRPASLIGDLGDRPVVIPLTTPGHRHAVMREALALGLAAFPALIDPTAIIARTSEIGEGTVVNAGTVVSAASNVGRFVHINRNVSVGHHTQLGDFATFGPACVLAGFVTVAPGAFVGAGAVCCPQVTIGANSVVGAGAVVVEDVPDSAVVVGNPARVVRVAEHGYGGVSVPLT